MTETILQTKLYVPVLRSPNLVPRPHLVERLNQGLHMGHKLTLISAPAGFGKTTLIADWGLRIARSNPESEIRNPKLCWLSLDEGDNDPTRFLAYFVAALNQASGKETTVGKGALAMLQSPQPPPEWDILTSLLNDVTAIPDRIILVLDDYHIIDSSPVDDALAFVLEHLPPQMHLVIATRDDPQLPLARLRARGQLTELRALDLRFSSSEAAEFLNQVMGLDLIAEDIAALETRTEGWIAGLQLAAISMQGQKNAAALVRSFTGSHRYVLDYLIEEVLEQQPESVQSFLLQTAVLDQMTGALCDALTCREDGQAMLQRLERANLFIVPLDEQRYWYRYHHLFSDLLRQRLVQKQPDWAPILQIRASKWYEQNGLVDESIAYALRAEDFARAAYLIAGQADDIWRRGEHAKLRRWLAKLPAELLVTKPHLSIIHAWYLFATGQPDAAEHTLQAAEQALDSLTGSDRIQLLGRAAAIRAFMDSYRGDVPGIIRHANLALVYLPEQDSAWRSITAIVLGDAHGFKGDMAAAYKARFEALQVCQAAGETYYAMLASMKLAITLRSQGQLQQTIEICRQQVQQANERGLLQTGLTSLLLLIEGEALAELNDLDGAISQAKKSAPLAEHAVDLAMLGWSFMCLVRIFFSKGDLAGAEETIQKMEHIARESHIPPWVSDQMAAWQARLWLAQGRLEAASHWAEDRGLSIKDGGESKPLHAIDFFLLIDYIIFARILIAQGRLDETVRLLDQLHKSAEAGGRTSRVIEIMILQALTFQAGGDTDRAVAALEEALTLAEPEGFVRIFIDEGRPMAQLLHEVAARGIAPDYVRGLLSAFAASGPEQASPTSNHSAIRNPQSAIIESLSERELEVLQLIAEGLTNQQIASRLFLSLNTVKAHTRNIYGKLSVHNRTQAVARARASGILPPT